MRQMFELIVKGPVGEDCISLAHVENAIAEAKEFGADLLLRIDSPGGDAFAGIAIHDLITNSGVRTVALIEGRADSAASLIALACSRIVARPGATIRLHDPSSSAESPTPESRKAVKAARDRTIAIYARTALRRDAAGLALAKDWQIEIESLMQADTVLDAEEALERHFIHAILPVGQIDPAEEVRRALLDESSALNSEVRELLEVARRWEAAL